MKKIVFYQSKELPDHYCIIADVSDPNDWYETFNHINTPVGFGFKKIPLDFGPIIEWDDRRLVDHILKEHCSAHDPYEYLNRGSMRAWCIFHDLTQQKVEEWKAEFEKLQVEKELQMKLASKEKVEQSSLF